MICIKCKRSNVVTVDSNTVKCQDCGYVFVCEIDDDADPVTFKSGEPNFDPRKYTCDSSWMNQWEKTGRIPKIRKLFIKVCNYFKG